MVGTSKDRIIKIIDQMTDEERLKQGITEAIRSGSDLTKDSSRKEYLTKFAYYQLQLCQNVSILEPYTVPTLDQMMDNNQTILSYLLRQLNQTMTTEDPLLFDFKAPLEFEIILLKDTQM